MLVTEQKAVRGRGTRNEACADLRDRFLAAVADSPDHSEGRLVLWRLIIEHPWYRAELASAARLAVGRVGRPSAWREDVEQEAMLLLAKKLRRTPGLGLDPRRARDSFGGWLGRVIRNDCRMAVRRLRRLDRGGPLPEDLPARCRRAERERRIDLSLAIEELPDTLRTVLLLSLKGFPLTEIAERLGLSYWQVWRAYRAGAGQLRQVFGTQDGD